MLELNAIHIAIIAVMTLVGAILGWIIRGKRAAEEKAAVSAGWQEQINAQRTEHDRLTDQNKGLMEQISQYQASNMDAKNRAKELSAAVQEAYGRRDELQREIKDIRGNLEVAMTERDQLQSDMSAKTEDYSVIQRKDAQINKLQLDLENWQNRLPPLIEKFRQRNEDALQLETELAAANERIAELESESLTDGRDASNDASDGAEAHNDGLLEAEQPLVDEDELEVELEAETEPADDNDNDNDNDNDAAISINGARDKLQAIKGVGPAIEKTLNEMGIFNYQQIADMSEYDIDRIANRLKGFRSRIYREDWIGQARDLRDQASSA
jgi:predicted flap endonuclease-1-like 5' DNA nuclease